MDRLRNHVVSTGLSLVRRRQPYVLWGNEPMNGGNYLFLWATAWARSRREGVEWRVRFKPKMEPWLQEFPALQELTVRQEDVSHLQRRTVEWGQDVGRDFFLAELKEFVRDVLLHGSGFPDRWTTVTPGATVVNVRRGDYYTNPRHRARYGFDIPGYVRAALARVDDGGTTPLVFVSDDPGWCLRELAPLVPGRDVSVMPAPHDMFQDLAQLSAARHLILANSTFSYWGGYIASARSRTARPKDVIAPLFFARDIYAGDESPLILGEWTAIPEDEYEPYEG